MTHSVSERSNRQLIRHVKSALVALKSEQKCVLGNVKRLRTRSLCFDYSLSKMKAAEVVKKPTDIHDYNQSKT